MQVAMSLFSLVVKALLLARTYWPVVTVVIAFIAKLASGDTSGLPEALSAIVAAIAAVRSGGRAEKAEKASMNAQAVALGAAAVNGPEGVRVPHPSLFKGLVLSVEHVEHFDEEPIRDGETRESPRPHPPLGVYRPPFPDDPPRAA